MDTNIIVLQETDNSQFLSELNISIESIEGFGRFLFFQHGKNPIPESVQVVLLVLKEAKDYSWLRREAQRYGSCPIKVVLCSSTDVAIGCLLMREVQGILVIKELSSFLIPEVLAPLLQRLNLVYEDCFDTLDQEKKGFLTAENFVNTGKTYGKQVTLTQAEAALTDINGDSGPGRVQKSQFLKWWRDGKNISNPVLSALLSDILEKSKILNSCGADVRRMLLIPDLEDVESSFSAHVSIGEVSDSPNISLKCNLDVSNTSDGEITSTFTFSVLEPIDVSDAKTSLESAVSLLLIQLKPYDKHGLILPYLKVSTSTGHRKVILTLSLAVDEAWKESILGPFEKGVFPLLRCSFAQFVELTLKANASVLDMVTDPSRTFLEHLSDGVDIEGDVFYWNFYLEVIAKALDPLNLSELLVAIIISAVKDGSFEASFGSVEELPSFVLEGFHRAVENRHEFLRLAAVKEFLMESTHELVAAIREVIGVLASKLDSKNLALKAKFLYFTFGLELTAPGLFEAFNS